MITAGIIGGAILGFIQGYLFNPTLGFIKPILKIIMIKLNDNKNHFAAGFSIVIILLFLMCLHLSVTLIFKEQFEDRHGFGYAWSAGFVFGLIVYSFIIRLAIKSNQIKDKK